MIKYIFLVSKSNIVHIHSGIPLFIFFHVIICKILFKKTLVTIHSTMIADSKYMRYFLTILLRNLKKVIFVNKRLPDLIKVKNFDIRPAFLPQMNSNEQLPVTIKNFISDQKDRKIIASNAFRLDFYENVDLYGLDMSIELLNYLVNVKKDQVSLIFIVSDSIKSKEYIKKILSKISEYNLDNFILLYLEPINFYKLIKESDIVLRATVTDGDALTVREGLYLSKIVVASDCAERPEGTVLFRNRDQKSLNAVAESVLTQKPKSAEYSTNKKDNNLYEYYVNLYKSII